MNQEIRKTFIIKLVGVSVCLAVVWHMVVSPQVKQSQEINQSFVLQNIEIEHGEQAVGQYSDQVHLAIGQMSLVRDQIITQLDVEGKVNVHKFLQESAESFGLTVARIEPMQTSIAQRVNQQTKGEVHLETSEFRVECSGTYGGVVQFIESLSNNRNIAKVRSFRVLPVSNESVRIALQVAVYRLVKIPDAFTNSFGLESAQLTSVGVNDAD